MNTTNHPPTGCRRLRSLLLPVLAGLAVGSGTTLLILYAIRGAASYPDDRPALAPFQVAGALAAENSTEGPDAAKKTASAKALAEKVLEMITRKDGTPIAPLCDLPFLGGAPHNQRIVNNQEELGKALNADLCKGPYAPFMYEKKWDTSTVLLAAAFFEQYSDFLVSRKELRKLIERLQLTPSDRVVVEGDRGMLLFVRASGDESRLIGIVPIGFRSLQREFKLTRDVIYGRKYGTSLTLDVLQPLKNANGGALLELNNGDFISAPKQYGDSIFLHTQTLLNAGYTVIYVTPSGTPKHSIPEALADVQRAVRFVRYNAKRLNLDPDRLAVMGSSSGGYLAHMVGLWTEPAPKFPPASDPTADLAKTDPVEAVSSCVQAVISYFGPTDWLNYGQPGKTIFEHDLPAFRSHHGIFDLFEFDADNFRFNKIADRNRQLQQLRKLSPVNLVSRSAAPTLIFHGDKDENVPLEQAETMYAALTKAGVITELVVKRGEGHGWSDNPEDSNKIVDWLNRHLRKKE
jgi:acetyl esterase/lipase